MSEKSFFFMEQLQYKRNKSKKYKKKTIFKKNVLSYLIHQAIMAHLFWYSENIQGKKHAQKEQKNAISCRCWYLQYMMKFWCTITLKYLLFNKNIKLSIRGQNAWSRCCVTGVSIMLLGSPFTSVLKGLRLGMGQQIDAESIHGSILRLSACIRIPV